MTELPKLLDALQAAEAALADHWKIVRPKGIGNPGPILYEQVTPEWMARHRELSKAYQQADAAVLANLQDRTEI